MGSWINQWSNSTANTDGFLRFNGIGDDQYRYSKSRGLVWYWNWCWNGVIVVWGPKWGLPWKWSLVTSKRPIWLVIPANSFGLMVLETIRIVITSQGACCGVGMGVGVGVFGSWGRKWGFPWIRSLGSTNRPIWLVIPMDSFTWMVSKRVCNVITSQGAWNGTDWKLPVGRNGLPTSLDRWMGKWA